MASNRLNFRSAPREKVLAGAKGSGAGTRGIQPDWDLRGGH
jgi:hypothetical protein